MNEEELVEPQEVGTEPAVVAAPEKLAEEPKIEPQAEPEITPEAQMRAMSRRSFLWAIAAGGASLAGWRWLVTRDPVEGAIWPLRRALQINEDIARDYFSTGRLAPQFAASQITRPARLNGKIGLNEDFDAANWKLRVEGLYSGEPLELSLAQIKKLPQTTIITELKCIEGWSTIVQWTGVRLRDFMKQFPPATLSGNAPDLEKPEDLTRYLSLETPGGGYYVGLEMASALHPQTLLCYAMNGAPLSPEHGAPLRLVVPVKYGIKYLKRIGTLQFTNQRPRDYWAERGYDWYAGH